MTLLENTVEDDFVEVIVISISEDLSAIVIDNTQLKDTISINNEIFHILEDGKGLGFYDWLRDFDGNIIGAYISLFLYDVFKIVDFSKLSSKVVFESESLGESLYIYWDTEKSIDWDNSSDEWFCYCNAYISDRGSLSITFDLDNLGKFQRDQMLKKINKKRQ